MTKFEVVEQRLKSFGDKLRGFENADTLESMKSKVTKLSDLTFKNLTAYGEFKQTIEKKIAELEESRSKEKI